MESIGLAGPYASMPLADLGAEVKGPGGPAERGAEIRDGPGEPP